MMARRLLPVALVCAVLAPAPFAIAQDEKPANLPPTKKPSRKA